MSKALRTSQICGGTPLVAGVGVFLVYLLDQATLSSSDSAASSGISFLMMALGFFVLLVGLSFFVIGSLALGVHVWKIARTPRGARRSSWRSALFSGAVLVLNFPVAGAILCIVDKIDPTIFEGHECEHQGEPGYRARAPGHYTVLIHNETDECMTASKILGCGQDQDIGALAPGQRKSCLLVLDERGTIEFRAESAEATYAVAVDVLIPPSTGGQTTVTLHPGGETTTRSYEIW